MHLKQLILCVLVGLSGKLIGQTRLEISHSWAGNLSLAKTKKSANRTKGYKKFPSFVSHHHNLKVGFVFNKRHKVSTSVQVGALSVGYSVEAYTKKYPKSNHSVDNLTTPLNYLSVGMGKLSSRTSVGLVKLSFAYENIIYSYRKTNHRLSFGVGFIKKRGLNGFLGMSKSKGVYGNEIVDGHPVLLANHKFTIDEFTNHRNFNVFLSLGYEFSYQFAKRWQLNIGFLYHQGLFKMLSWHAYREYNEFATSYTEFDEQWTHHRLSHFELNAGITFQIHFPKKE